MGALTLQAFASMSYTEFQKIIDEEGKISGLQWFKNSGLFMDFKRKSGIRFKKGGSNNGP